MGGGVRDCEVTRYTLVGIAGLGYKGSITAWVIDSRRRHGSPWIILLLDISTSFTFLAFNPRDSRILPKCRYSHGRPGYPGYINLDEATLEETLDRTDLFPIFQVPAWYTDTCRNRWAWDASRCTNPCRRATRCTCSSASARSCKTIYQRRRYCCQHCAPDYADTPAFTGRRCASDSPRNADDAATILAHGRTGLPYEASTEQRIFFSNIECHEDVASRSLALKQRIPTTIRAQLLRACWLIAIS